MYDLMICLSVMEVHCDILCAVCEKEGVGNSNNLRATLSESEEPRMFGN